MHFKIEFVILLLYNTCNIVHKKEGTSTCHIEESEHCLSASLDITRFTECQLTK